MRFHHLLLLVPLLEAVKREDFKTCAQSGFCTRQRASHPNVWEATYTNPGTIVCADGVRTVQLQITRGNTKTWRVEMRNEKRHNATTAFRSKDYFKEGTYTATTPTANTVQLSANDDTAALITLKPFHIDFIYNGTSMMQFNAKQFLYLEDEKTVEIAEKLIPKVEPADDETASAQAEVSAEIKALYQDLQAEKWKHWEDKKPQGPTSLGVDTTFPKTWNVFGLAEHASDFNLKSTCGKDANFTDPFRLFNVDICEYEIDNPMALYGSIPMITAHGEAGSVAIFWNNEAETWVDIEREDTSGYFQKGIKQTTAHWMSESGALDLFVFLGPSPKDISRQYSEITGTTTLPPLGTTAYHQCRWNYVSTTDVAQVDRNMDIHQIPYDVLWLDIEYTEDKKYFTWHPHLFGDSVKMLSNLDHVGRTLVAIIDPHIKQTEPYYIYEEAKAKDLFIHDRDGNQFVGECWPGKSSWIDYTNPEAQQYWAEQYQYDKFIGSAPNLHIWNDMNEPSVFDGPEITMPKDALHYGNVEHRDIHNVYGILQVKATYEGLRARDKPSQRPFILSRAFFAGSQRFGAIWTGDNRASWDHLAISVPMLLSVGLNGIAFCGADVGGFFADPEPELLSRWYQLGAYTPFFRAHAHIDARRREPYLAAEPYFSIQREAIRDRYALSAYWYELFFHTHLTGCPMLRPLWMQYPQDQHTWSEERQFMVGESIMVSPVVAPGARTADTYFPGGIDKWYNLKDFQAPKGKISADSLRYEIVAEVDYIPVFIKQGAIIPWRIPNRRSVKLMQYDPLTLIVTVDGESASTGTFFQDDGETFAYHSGGNYVYRQFVFDQGTLSSKQYMIPAGETVSGQEVRAESDTFRETMDWISITQIVFVGLMKIPEITGLQVTKGKPSSIGQHCKTGGAQSGGWRVECPLGLLTAGTEWEVQFSRESMENRHDEL